jgi:phenylacetate-CoA ligase
MPQPLASRILPLGSSPGAFLTRGAMYYFWPSLKSPGQAKYSKFFRTTEYVPQNMLEDLQARHLRTLLLHAYRNVPFYRKRMEDLGITPLDIQSASDLCLLPAVTRSDLEQNRANLMARDSSSARHARTDAQPIEGDRQRMAVHAALSDRYRRSAGLFHGIWCASLRELESPGPPRRGLRALASFCDQLVHRRFTLDLSGDWETAFYGFVQRIRRSTPSHVVGKARLVSEFARYCERNKVVDIRFSAAVIEGGLLSQESRDLIESVFSARVFTQYGCPRIPVIAWECNEHSGLHVNADAMIVEIEPFPGSPPGHGRVLVTELFNHRMPLIRYEVGEVATWAASVVCDCGRSLPRLIIQGRLAEFLSRQVPAISQQSTSTTAMGSYEEGERRDRRRVGKEWLQ